MSEVKNLCNEAVVKSPSIDFLLKQVYSAHRSKVKDLEAEIQQLKQELQEQKNRKNECTQCKHFQSSLKRCKEYYSEALSEQKRRIQILEIQILSLQNVSPSIIKSEIENPLKRNFDKENSFAMPKRLKSDKLNTAVIHTSSQQHNFFNNENSYSVIQQSLNNSISIPETEEVDLSYEVHCTQQSTILETNDFCTVGSLSLIPSQKPLTNNFSSCSTSDAYSSSRKEDSHSEEVTDVSNGTESSNCRSTTDCKTNTYCNKMENEVNNSFTDIDETYLPPLLSGEKENNQCFKEADDEKISIVEEIPASVIDEHESEVPVKLNSFERVPAKEVKYKYKEECIRKKDERRKLPGHNCHQCKQYYDQLDLTENEKAKRMKNCSRHRAMYNSPSTPEHYWELDFPNTAICRERGYINETQKRELKVRRRHPLQVKQTKKTV